MGDESNIDEVFFIGLLDLLQQLYGRVDVPPAVVREASSYAADAIASATSAAWLVEVALADPSTADGFERDLGGRGEAEAIALALQTPDAVVLVDEQAARRFATARGLPVRGSLGVLIDAKRHGLVSAVRPQLDRLRATGF